MRAVVYPYDESEVALRWEASRTFTVDSGHVELLISGQKSHDIPEGYELFLCKP